MHALRRRLTYANVMATIALFIALGGTSVAAVQLARDSVGSEQVVNGSMRSSDIRDGTITHDDVRDGTLRGKDMATNTVGTRNLGDSGVQADDLDADSVTGRAVRDGSITARDLADGTIPQLQKLTEDGPAGVPSLRTLGSGTTQAAAGNDPRLSDARTPTGAAGGDLTGDYPAPGLANGSIDALSLFSPSLQDGAAGTPTLRSLGSSGGQAAAGNDPRLSDARTPTDSSVSTAKFATLPHGKMRQTGTCQSFTTGTFQNVRFDDLQFGDGVTFDNAADSLVVGTAGTYIITGEINWAQDGTGTRGFELFEGGNEVAFDGRQAAVNTNTGQNATAIVRLPAGAAVRAQGGHTRGSDLSFANAFGDRCASLAVQWIGP